MLIPSCARLRRRSAAFTLLEVMLAVAITALVTVSVYRFVRGTLTAISYSQELSSEQQEIAGLLNFLQVQLEDLPTRSNAALLGNANKFNGLASDEMEWVSRAGHGVMTASAPDEYRVTLAIQPAEKAGSELEIGLRRQPINEDSRNYRWLPLLRPAAALEIRYYNPRTNVWEESWKERIIRPSLVRVRVWRTADSFPVEAVLPVPSARMQNVVQ